MVELQEREIFVVVFSIVDPLERQITSERKSDEVYRRLLSQKQVIVMPPTWI